MADNVDLPACPEYHPNSELNGRPGYYPNVSAAQLAAVNQLRSEANDLGLNYKDAREHEFLKLLRFCRARQFDVPRALIMLKNDVEWRESLEDLKDQTAQEVLQCDLGIVYKFFPSWVAGKDRQLRPVAWRQFGKLEIWELCKITTVEHLVRFHAWEAEQAIRLMYDGAASTGYNIETFVIVIDAAHWHLGLATADAFRFIQGMVSTDSDHYPERLGACIIINAPGVLSIAWRVICNFLDDVTKKKVQILSHQDDWLPVLLRLMDEDQIPRMYGGTHPDPDPACAFDTMNPPSRLVSSSSLPLPASSPEPGMVIPVKTKPPSHIEGSPDRVIAEARPPPPVQAVTKQESILGGWYEWLLSADSVSFPEDGDQQLLPVKPKGVDAWTQTEEETPMFPIQYNSSAKKKSLVLDSPLRFLDPTDYETPVAKGKNAMEPRRLDVADNYNTHPVSCRCVCS